MSESQFHRGGIRGKMPKVLDCRSDPRRWLRRLLTATGALLLLAVLGVYVTSTYLVRKSFTHRVEKLLPVPDDLRGRAESIASTSADVFPRRAGGFRPVASRGRRRPARHGRPRCVLLLLPQARFLNAVGWSAFFLDMRAHGRSGGTRIGLSLEEPRDVGAAIDWVGIAAGVQGDAGRPARALHGRCCRYSDCRGTTTSTASSA